MQENKKLLFGTVSSLFCVSLIVANILAFKQFQVGWFVVPTAVLVFPVVYICNDVLAEVYGFNFAKKVIMLGFGANLIATILYNVAILLPYPTYFEGQEAFKLVLSNSFRVLCASLFSYLIGSFTNAYVLEKMKGRSSLFSRCVTSTLFGESVDAFFFITLAFIGTMPFGSLMWMVVCQAGFKTLYEMVVFPVTNKVIEKIKAVELIEQKL